MWTAATAAAVAAAKAMTHRAVTLVDGCEATSANLGTDNVVADALAMSPMPIAIALAR